MTDDRRFVFLLTSAREEGNSEALARLAAKSLPAEVEQRWLSLLTLDLAPFEDVRHSETPHFPPPTGDAATLLEETLSATDLVLVAPLYWYSIPARAKNYLDHWSGWMRVPGVHFLDRMAGKRMWAVSAISDEDRSVADPLIGTLELTANYMAMHWQGCLFGFGNRPGEVLEDGAAVEAAKHFFGRGPID